MIRNFKKFPNKISNLKLSDICVIIFLRILRLTVGSLIKLLNSLFALIKFKKADEFSSTLESKFASLASSYKAKEYLLAEVFENPLLLLNLFPLKY